MISVTYFICVYIYIIFKNVKTILSSQAVQKQTIGQICPMGYSLPITWNCCNNHRSTCKNTETWKSTVFTWAHNHNLEWQVSPNYQYFSSGNILYQWGDWGSEGRRAGGQRGRGAVSNLSLLSAATFGQHWDPPFGVTAPVGPDVTSQSIRWSHVVVRPDMACLLASWNREETSSSEL